MSKGMTIFGMVVSVLIFVLFVMDLIVGFPFQNSQSGGILLNILYILAAVGLGVISWTTYRELD